MAFDLKDLSEKDLKALITQAKKQQSALNKRKPIAQIRKKLVALAKVEGYTIAELFGGKAPAAKTAARTAAKKAAKKAGTTRKVAPKYRNPANAKETWSGRGKQPRWLAEQVKKGKKPEDFLIRK
jgi:DNA-binding protein H-NS